MEWNFSSASSSTIRTKSIDLSHIPVTQVDKGAKGLGIFLMFFASLWGGIPTAALISAIKAGKLKPEMLFMLIFTVIGIALFVSGLHLLFSSTITTIDGERVIVTKKSMFGMTQWSEFISGYEGVQSRNEYHSGGKNSPSYTLYIVEMLHKEPKKTVLLYQSDNNEMFRIIWEDYCQKLNLPAVETDGSKMIKRDVADLDKSVRELVKEGKVQVEFDPSKPPPPELSLKVDGDVLELTVVKKKSSPASAAIALLIPGVFMYIGFFVKSCPLMFGIIGAVFFLVFLAAFVWSLIVKDQIRISKDEIHILQLTPWGPTIGDRISSETVEVVRIGKESNQGRDAVLIETDNGNSKVGEGLSAESLEWLKNCIMRVISA
jgi:hypothetical protein